MFGLPNVQLGQWSPKWSLAQLVGQMSNNVGGVQCGCLLGWFAKCPTGSVESKMFACAIVLPHIQLGLWIQCVCSLNVQLGQWIQYVCAIVSCLCMRSKLFITGNKAIPSSSSRWHLCLHARLFVNWDLLGWYFGCVFSETILVNKY